jgi:Fic family protein
MHTFRTIDRQIGTVRSSVVVALGRIDNLQGRLGALSERGPETLSALRGITRIQSVESSNAIEGITAPSERMRALVLRQAPPESRPEEELAGYRTVLDTINADAPRIPFKPSVVEQLHRDLYRFTGTPAGRFKQVENSIQEVHADGTRLVRFRTVSASETPTAMEELHERFTTARESGAYHPLMLIGCYVFDFLAIHPFRDGNGRISRLLTLLALYQSGYEIGRFISLERLIDQTRDSYYDALQLAGRGWHEDAHDIGPWLHYFLGILTAAHNELALKTAPASARGAKREAIAEFIRGSIAEELTVADVRRAVPTASDSYIDKTLARLRDEGLIEPLGRGRNARWRRITPGAR